MHNYINKLLQLKLAFIQLTTSCCICRELFVEGFTSHTSYSWQHCKQAKAALAHVPDLYSRTMIWVPHCINCIENLFAIQSIRNLRIIMKFLLTSGS